MSAQPDRFESDLNAKMSHEDDSERAYAIAKAEAKEMDFADLMNEQGFSQEKADTIAVEYVEELVMALRTGSEAFEIAVNEFKGYITQHQHDVACSNMGSAS